MATTQETQPLMEGFRKVAVAFLHSPIAWSCTRACTSSQTVPIPLPPRPPSPQQGAHLDAGGDEEDLLLQAQLLAVLGGVVGVQHRRDVVRLASLQEPVTTLR